MPTYVFYPTANAAYGGGWTDPTNAYADDTSYATIANLASASKGSYFKTFQTGGVSIADTIPSGATLVSVIIELYWKVSSKATGNYIRLRAYDDTTALFSEQYLVPLADDTYQTNTYDMTASVSVAQLRSATFQVRALAQNTTANATNWSLDYVKVTVEIAATTVTGTLEATLGALTTSSGGKVTVQGSSTKTLGDITISSGGKLVVEGNTGVTLDGLAISSEGAVTNGVTGSAAITLGGLTVGSEGTIKVEGESTPILGGLTLSSGGKVTVAGSATITLGGLSVVSTGKVVVVGEATITLGGLVSASSTIHIVYTIPKELRDYNIEEAIRTLALKVISRDCQIEEENRNLTIEQEDRAYEISS